MMYSIVRQLSQNRLLFRLNYLISIPAILAWGYSLKLNNQKSLVFKFLNFYLFNSKTLTAFWAAIKFAQIESLKGMQCFEDLSPELLEFSCGTISDSHLTYPNHHL
jgi:hypothetical protein